MQKGKVLAIDYGLKNVGLALSDEDRTVAQSIPKLKNIETERLIQELKQIIDNEKVSLVLFGLPLGNTGNTTLFANTILEFIDAFKDRVTTSVETINESMTTQLAQRNSKKLKYKKKNIDSEAARIFLQEYLDYKNDEE